MHVLKRFQDEDGFVGYRSPLLTHQGIPHLFTTRIGGTRRRDLDPSSEAQRERVTLAAGLPGASIMTVRQVHGAAAIRVGPEPLPGPECEADALVSERADVLVGVHTADCVPVLVARSDGRRVAAVHAGWRGLVAGVIPRALGILGEGRVLAAIGPCLSRERFEVGEEVVEAFRRAGLAEVVHRPREGRARIDLRAAARLQLEAAGVELVDTSDRCTYEHGEEFYSYRRDVTHGGGGRTGRMSALIAARPERRRGARGDVPRRPGARRPDGD